MAGHQGDHSPRSTYGNGRQSGATPQAWSTNNQHVVAPPTVSLPKGGGAIRSIGEKFAANPVTGTGALTIPIAISPGRSNLAPQLTLSYDSGAGNGLFGLGWSLALPTITRKTDKRLPQYHDPEEADTYLLSGAEDLVPVLTEVGGKWQREVRPPRTVDGVTYRVERYRPRTEGLFARIERWTAVQSGAIHWRSITKDNVTTLYGTTNNSRIFDPDDPTPDHPTRIFSWLICATYDDKGNAIVYEYEAENSAGVDPSHAHEANRSVASRAANRHIKRIKYGNRRPNRDAAWNATDPALLTDWMFEVVFDYGEGHYTSDDPDAEDRQFVTAQPATRLPWSLRRDPFSSYRAGFEVRTYRLCRRILMFHHFPQELGIADYLVRATELSYAESSVASFITQATQSSYLHQPQPDQPNRYLRKSLPPLDFTYSRAPDADELARQPILEVDRASLEHLPYGLDGTNYQWVDLDGEGLSGILTEQAEGWFYKRNLSANNRSNGDGHITPRFGPIELVAEKPVASLVAGRSQLMDLDGDGRIDLVQMGPTMRGFYERTQDGGWTTFRPFASWPNIDPRDPNLKFIDLDGDGHADMLITEHEAFTWYPSLTEAGFGPARHVRKTLDEERGPRLVFADGTQSIYLADMSGDGLTDLARIRNGEVCYWPNLGYGRFGSRVVMDDAPCFDRPDLFDQRRVRLADIDGSGVTDILYLHQDGVKLYFNQSGNRWGPAVPLPQFPPVDTVSSVQALDLLGNGTVCLVWSSPLPGHGQQPMRYLSLIDKQKPHLLIKLTNNLGAETHIHYAPSTKFYLDDREAGNPWITRLPFPVHVVERMEIYDHVSSNRFVTRYAYHHGFFDGVEREFRGFGMVEQWDTEEIGTVDPADGEAANWDAASFVPPVLTRTWFHTGARLQNDVRSHHLAREYYGAPSGSDPNYTAKFAAFLLTLLPDTVLPPDVTADDEHAACRSLKGSMLRQEVYGLDGTAQAAHPYTVTEQSFTIKRLQPASVNRHPVFFTHAREAISYHYERKPADPRISHTLTLDVDRFGNVLKSVAIGYGRKASSLPEQRDQRKQTQTLITYTVNSTTNPIDEPDSYRAPLPSEARTYQLHANPATNGYQPTGEHGLFQIGDFVTANGSTVTLIGDDEVVYEAELSANKSRRLIEHLRTLYRKNDLSGLLPLGALESLGLPGERYKLAFTPGLLAQTYRRTRDAGPAEDLLPDLQQVLGGTQGDQGGYRSSETLRGLFPANAADPRWTIGDNDGHWWLPSGRIFYSRNANDDPGTELAFARAHYFLPHCFRDPFGQSTSAAYDSSADPARNHNLRVVETRDPLGNTVQSLNDYRVLQPRLITDPNGNRSAAIFDVLGMVVGMAIMGKVGGPIEGDSFAAFTAELTSAQVRQFFDAPDPRALAVAHLGTATTRIIYDLERVPACAASIARETHVGDLAGGQQSKVQVNFVYSDGLGREAQTKIQAEPGPLDPSDPNAPLLDPRWVGSGTTIFNNKGKPVRQYEPFFSPSHRFGIETHGVSSTLCYDPAGRAVVTLHPNHTYEKVVFDSWQQTTYDTNDTVTFNPATDADAGGFFARLPAADYLPTWHSHRIAGALGPHEQIAAQKAAVHADTPTIAHVDTLGRPFLTLAHNAFQRRKPDLSIEIVTEPAYHSRVELDIEGNQRAVLDARDQVVMRYRYDLLGNRIHQASMEAGECWTLNDVKGNPIRAWDRRGHQFRLEYDRLRRLVRQFVAGADAARSDPRTLNRELLIQRIEYGEDQPNAAALNLRTRVFRHADSAGVLNNTGRDPVTNREQGYDFKGNLLSSSRQLAQDYKGLPDWSGPVPLAAPIYRSHTTYDALNRPVTLTSPDASTIRPSYNEANLLNAVEANLRGEQENGQPVWTPFVANIDYDAKGQRTLIRYGNGAETRYRYDRETLRLIRLYTRRGPAFTEDCGDEPPPPRVAAPAEPPQNQPCGLQNLQYTYDPIGNLTHIQDDAQQTIFFRNRRVEPSSDYTYDALYRLIEATGREHLGQTGAGAALPPASSSYNDRPRVGLPHPHERNAMGAYVEAYLYDAAGNVVEVRHRGSDPVDPGWTRAYAYAAPSLLEPGKQSNLLTATALNPHSNQPQNEAYSYDDHGNLTGMPHLQIMQWDVQDRLQMTQRQAVNAADDEGVQKQGERTYYVYDAGGQRVRKVTELATGQLKDERIYLGGCEIYRRQGVNAVVRETLHIMDDQRRIAIVETRAEGNDGFPRQLIRYQLGNHLGSAALELDRQAEVISYEEYYPYGSTSYQALLDPQGLPLKRYRYTGKERDEETGFTYHGARYYAPWLGRWISCDPAGLVDGPNLYRYVRNNPIRLHDPSGHQALEPSFQLPTPSLLDTRSAQERMAERLAGSLVPPLRLNPPISLFPSLPLPVSSSSSSAAPASTPASSSSSGPHVSGGILPPRLQLDWGRFHASADTSSTSLRLDVGGGRVTAGYAYGGAISLTSRGPTGAGTVSVDPSSRLTTFRVEGTHPGATTRFSGNTEGQFGAGLTTHGVTADVGFNPWRESFSVSFGIGGAPAPIYAPGYTGRLLPELGGIMQGGIAGGTSLLGAAPGMASGILSNPTDAPAIIREHQPDIGRVTGAVGAGRSIADIPRHPTSPDIRLRFNLSYSPLVTPPPNTPEPARPTGGLSVTGTLQIVY